MIDAGGAIVEVLLDGTTSRVPPTEGEIAAWVEAYDLTVTTVGRIDDRAREVFTDREYAYIVDLRTMTVVWSLQSLYTDPTIAEIGITTILADYL